MASGSSAQSYSSALTASTTDLVVLTGGGYGVQVTNVTRTADIWFTVSQRGGPCPVPTVAGNSGEFCAASVGNVTQNVRADVQFGAVVQLISTGTPTYTVSLLGQQAPM
jgi:hypothetical protein